MQKKTLALAISAVMCSAYAQENSTELGTVEVTDSAFQEQVRSITNEKLENMQATDIKDILKTLPSVTVDGASRYSQKVYVRGLEDRFANITVDGARLTGQLFHHSGDQTVDAEMLKIGEVELGPNSALSGPGVINGSFIYETKDPSDMLEDGQTFGGKFAIGYQSAFERRKANLALYGAPSDMFEYLLSGNIVNDSTVKTPVLDEDSKNSKMKSGLAKIVVKMTDDMRFDFSYNLYEDGGKRPLSGEKPGNDNEDNPYNEINRQTVTGKFSYNPSDMVDLSVKLYGNEQKLEREALTEDAWVRVNGEWEKDGTRRQPARTYTNATKGFDIRNTSILNDTHTLTYGIESSVETQDKDADGLATYLSGSRAGETENVAFTGEGELKHYGFYIEDEMNFDKWVFNLGARFDKYQLGGVYSGDFSQFSPKAKLSFQATDKLKLRTGYGRIFRGPQLGETLMLADGLVQSTNTKASSGHNIEVGFDYDLSEAIGAENSLLGFTAYRYNVDNYAHPTKNTALSAQGDMEIWGLETVFTMNKDKLALNLSHTYTDGELSNYDSGLKYEPRTANIHTFKIDADYRVNDQWSLNYNAQLVPGNKYTRQSRGAHQVIERAGYGVHNIGATYEPTALKGAKINFGIDNVFDKAYTRHTAFGTYFGSTSYTAYEAERNFKIDFSYKF